MVVSHSDPPFSGIMKEIKPRRRCSPNYTAAACLFATQRVHRDQQRSDGRDKAQKAQQITVAHQLTPSFA